MRYVIDRRFNSSVERTPRVLEIAEGFGLGLSQKEFVIYDNLAIDIEPGDVVYITGQSGSGKSLLLRDLAFQMGLAYPVDENGQGGKPAYRIADLNQIELPDRPVVDCFNERLGTTHVLDCLAKAGISDAWIYIRKPSELSDGQRYRLKLAMLIANDSADIWIADEFGAILDRPTAKCVAFNMQKVARAMRKTLLIATTHTDLREELGPSLTITKRFREKVLLET